MKRRVLDIFGLCLLWIGSVASEVSDFCIVFCWFKYLCWLLSLLQEEALFGSNLFQMCF